MKFQAQKGTRDILPNESYKWQYIENAFQKLALSYGYGEIRTPMFEATALFNRGVGETTDIVQKEMYTFDDQGGRSITLKPEGTSPAVRAFINSNEIRAVQPSKIFYDTPCFRYEKAQANRYRQFHQFGIEIFGSSSMLADAEAISFAANFLKNMGITDLELRINSVGCKECRPGYRKALQDFIRPNFERLSEDSKIRFEKNPMRILDSKDEMDREIVKDAPTMLDYLCDDCKAAFNELKNILDEMGIEYVVDTNIVRGLDYYTKTAFEVVSSNLGAQGTVCGGGRYDGLIKEVGGPDMPGVGFGMGKERLIRVMEDNGHDFGGIVTPEFFVAFASDDAKLYAVRLVRDLREAGKSVDMDTCDRKLKGQMKFANKVGAKYSIIIGEDEIKTDELTIKDMESGEQRKIRRSSLLKDN